MRGVVRQTAGGGMYRITAPALDGRWPSALAAYKKAKQPLSRYEARSAARREHWSVAAPRPPNRTRSPEGVLAAQTLQKGNFLEYCALGGDRLASMCKRTQADCPPRSSRDNGAARQKTWPWPPTTERRDRKRGLVHRRGAGGGVSPLQKTLRLTSRGPQSAEQRSAKYPRRSRSAVPRRVVTSAGVWRKGCCRCRGVRRRPPVRYRSFRG